MPIQRPFNFKKWIEEHRHLLKPPVGNQCVYDAEDFIVMVVGGPNSRKDYHYDDGEEFFYQLEGDITVKIQEDGKAVDVPIREGEMFLLPPRVPHNPVRGANTIGMVIERKRRSGERDGLLWFCENCNEKLYEEYFQLEDITTQFQGVFKKFYGDENLRTCKNCGTVMQPPPVVKLTTENVTEEDKGFQISPKFYKKDWEKLDLENNVQEDWNTAVTIFRDRIEGKFLKQIELMDKNLNREIGIFAGFAIMSLDCLLIETLEQFYKGKIRTGQGMDEEAFFSFFKRSEKFKAFFDTQTKASIFYRQIRCGLLHQAQTKKKSTIHIKDNKPMLEWVDEANFEEGLKIHRRMFHKEVIEIYDKYIEKITNPKDLNSRKKFRRKMEHIIGQR